MKDNFFFFFFFFFQAEDGIRDPLVTGVQTCALPIFGFVVCATLFSLATQAFVIGGGTASIAGQIGTSPGMLLLALLPHALPELVALFLPLAAWMIASRRGDWHELLAATVVTVGVAIPVLLAAAAVEGWVSPNLLLALES